MIVTQHRILIIDFGSQYTQLIARRIRDIGVYCEIFPYFCSEQEIKLFAPNGIILSGGPDSVTVATTMRAPEIVFTLGCPVLGICYGMQTMAMQLQGHVIAGTQREFGYANLQARAQSPLLQNCLDTSLRLAVWMSHGDHVDVLPSGFAVLATNENNIIAAMANEHRRFYGVQFHPEVTHTPQGKQLLTNFVTSICGCDCQWTAANIIDHEVQRVKEMVGNDHVILGLSGGVDSMVTAALLQRAIGAQLHCIFVDNGLLRQDEVQQVQTILRREFAVDVHVIDASTRFLQALAGITDPEQKRKIIGNEFIEVFQEQAKKLGDIQWLAQGTIYPDVIESAAKGGGAHVIKSHHNVGGLPEKMHLKLIEPLRELFKDEVRDLGEQLGLPTELLHRHPFPGPGLAVRIVGEVKAEYLQLLRQADHIFLEELHRQQLYQAVGQAFAVFLPIKTVAVMGDARCYDYVIALRAVETHDFMTAHWAKLPHEFLQIVASRITNEISGISRVVYDISSKPPATIEWE